MTSPTKKALKLLNEAYMELSTPTVRLQQARDQLIHDAESDARVTNLYIRIVELGSDILELASELREDLALVPVLRSPVKTED